MYFLKWLCITRFLLAACGIFFAAIIDAEAISWQWAMIQGRERITIFFDSPNQGKIVSRVNTTQLEVPLSDSPNDLLRIGNAPSADSLLSDVSLNGSKLHINLRDAAFGYVTTAVNPNQLVVDIFSDPLGNRWRSLGVPAPASAPSRAASALPEVPETTPKQLKVPEVQQKENKEQSNKPQSGTVPKKKSDVQNKQEIVKVTSEKKALDVAKPSKDSPQVSPISSEVDTKKLQVPEEKETSKIKDEKAPVTLAVPPPSEEELTKLTTKIEKLPQNSDEYTWTERKNNQASMAKENGTTSGIVNNGSSESMPADNPKTPETTKVIEIPINEGQEEDHSVNSLRGSINTKGPEAWSKETALNTLDKLEAALKTEPEISEKREVFQPLSDSTQEKPNTEPSVVYVDDKGNPVEKPLDANAVIEEAKNEIKIMQFQKAKELLASLKSHALVPEQREEVLYLVSEVNERIYKDRWIEGYEPIVTSTNKAMNFNLRSPRVAEALMRLGMINLKTGNQDEAEGYFGALRRKFPNDPLVPEGYLALGKDQFSKGQYADAVKTFQLIMDNYPESKAVQDAARFMAESLFKQGHYKRATILVDFVDRRWPRLYLDDPDYLTMVGDLYSREDRLDDALKSYWTYYNLSPDAKNNDGVLFKIGNLYLKKGLLQGGKDVLGVLLKKYPDSALAPKALLTLGEEQVIKENPTIQELVTIFENPSSTIPEIYYKKILDEYPNSPEAQQATIRLAAWKLWHRDIPAAMTIAQQFINKNPESPYVPRAEEIIARGFDQSFALALQEENYERILSLWEKYPYLQIAYKNMRDELRVALARAYLNRGDEKKGMDMLTKFLDSPQDPNYGDYAYNLFLAHYLRKEDWNNILDLGEKVSSWKFPASARAQLDYAMAIAAENLGLGNKALPLWERLYQREDIPLYQKAYATYFMARDAERRRDLSAAYKLNLNTLKLFVTLEEERSDKADPERVRESLAALMDVTEVANRFVESLEWADQYAAFVPETSPDYAGLLFRKARLYRKMGDLTKWKTLLDEIVRREPDSVFGRMAASELRTYEVSRDLSRFTQ